MLVTPIKTRIFQERESLSAFLFDHLPTLKDEDIVVVTSKIVALSEGRTAPFVNEASKEALIKQESDWAMKTKGTWLTIKNNMVLASAGIDESNANGKLILLPKDSYLSAETIRQALLKKYRLKKLGVIVTDSRLLPLRAGIVGIALGYAGIKGVKDCRGQKDLFNRTLKLTRIDIADSLATAAVLTMGECAETQPLALIRQAPVAFIPKTDRKELEIDIKEDIYQPLFEKIKKLKITFIK